MKTKILRRNLPATLERGLERLPRVSVLLLPGGSIAVNAAGFSENLDVNGDGVDDYTRRWEVLDLGDRKEIRVRTISLLTTLGPAKETTLHLLLAPE